MPVVHDLADRDAGGFEQLGRVVFGAARSGLARMIVAASFFQRAAVGAEESGFDRAGTEVDANEQWPLHEPRSEKRR